MRRGQKGREWGEKRGSSVVIFYSRQQACGLAVTPVSELLYESRFFYEGLSDLKKKNEQVQSSLPAVLTQGYGSIKYVLICSPMCTGSLLSWLMWHLSQSCLPPVREVSVFRQIWMQSHYEQAIGTNVSLIC